MDDPIFPLGIAFENILRPFWDLKFEHQHFTFFKFARHTNCFD